MQNAKRVVELAEKPNPKTWDLEVDRETRSSMLKFLSWMRRPKKAPPNFFINKAFIWNQGKPV